MPGGTRPREGVNVVTLVIFTCIRLHFVAASRFLGAMRYLDVLLLGRDTGGSPTSKDMSRVIHQYTPTLRSKTFQRPLLSATPSVAPSSSLSI